MQYNFKDNIDNSCFVHVSLATEKDAQEEAAEKLRDAEEAVRIARFKEIAKTKVADLIKKHGDLDKHLKEQYSNLEKILKSDLIKTLKE